MDKFLSTLHKYINLEAYLFNQVSSVDDDLPQAERERAADGFAHMIGERSMFENNRYDIYDFYYLMYAVTTYRVQSSTLHRVILNTFNSIERDIIDPDDDDMEFNIFISMIESFLFPSLNSLADKYIVVYEDSKTGEQLYTSNRYPLQLPLPLS